jgi:hypothetical protein
MRDLRFFTAATLADSHNFGDIGGGRDGTPIA